VYRLQTVVTAQSVIFAHASLFHSCGGVARFHDRTAGGSQESRLHRKRVGGVSGSRRTWIERPRERCLA
jgi:hypothetical protein